LALGYIGDVFDDAGLQLVDVPPEKLPSGMRRSPVEQYYSGVREYGPDDDFVVLVDPDGNRFCVIARPGESQRDSGRSALLQRPPAPQPLTFATRAVGRA
jgi:hypothetical protein